MQRMAEARRLWVLARHVTPVDTKSATALFATCASAATSTSGEGHVVVVGASVLDVNATAGDGHALVPGGSVPGAVRFAPGGVGRNIADGVVRMSEPGVLVTLVSVVRIRFPKDAKTHHRQQYCAYAVSRQ